MTSSPDKLHDEMLENRKGSGGVEAGFGEVDGKAMRSVVFKMDIRYACPSSITTHNSPNSTQNPPHPRPLIPLFLHRPHKCRQRENPRPGERYQYQ